MIRKSSVLLLALGLLASAHAADGRGLPPIKSHVLTLAVAEGKAIRIPQQLLVERHGIPGVFVAANNEARFRMVRPGKVSRGQQEILSGLFGNETLVVDELDRLRDGSPLKVIE